MRWGRLATVNYRGVHVPRVLGLGLLASALLATVVVEAVREVGAGGWGALVGSALVLAAGLIDDLVPIGPRGLRGHARSLLEGRMTTGILKVIVAVAAAVVVVALQPPRPGWVRVAGVILIAGCANVWNGLDVRPGRALKAFLVPGVAFALWGDAGALPVEIGVLVGTLVAMPFDLRELAMLGDGGANLLGFVAGVGLYAILSDGGVLVAAVVAVALNVVADTVSFSRVIETSGPLRWIDHLGRVAPDG